MMLPGMEPALPPVAADGAGGDEWYTMPWLLAWFGPIALDPCFSHKSHVRAACTIDLRRGEDGLTYEWDGVLQRAGNPPGIVFVNLPFSNTGAWLRKCRIEAARIGRVVVALVPAIPGDGPWHQDVWPYAPCVGNINGRVDFVNPDGRVDSKGRGHALILYGSEAACLALAHSIALASRGHAQSPVWVRRFAP